LNRKKNGNSLWNGRKSRRKRIEGAQDLRRNKELSGRTGEKRKRPIWGQNGEKRWALKKEGGNFRQESWKNCGWGFWGAIPKPMAEKATGSGYKRKKMTEVNGMPPEHFEEEREANYLSGKSVTDIGNKSES